MAYNQQPYYNGGFYPQYQNGAMPDMLNQYKGQYQQPIQQPIQQNIPQMQQNFQPLQAVTQQKSNNELIWVQGEAGAKGYLVAPNNTVVLWDTESKTIYVKSADANGIPSMRILDFEERSQTNEIALKSHKCTCGDKFITKEEFADLRAKFEELQAKYDALTDKPKRATKKEVEANG